MTKKRKTKPTSISKPLIADLPPEIIAEILSFLPVKTLIKFRCVSKSWFYLISNPKFINTHLIKSSNSTNFTHHRLIFGQLNINIAPCSLLYHLYSYSLPNHNSSNLNNVVELDYPVEDRRWVSIVGSCNGLVCITIEKVRVFIWNPSIRKSKELQKSDIDYWCDFTNYGFGYDQLNDDYKVVRIAYNRSLDRLCEDEVKIYSLKKDSWGKIGKFRRGFRWYDQGKYVNGKLHWNEADVRAYDPSMAIVSLDLGNETYEEIAQPCYGDGTIIRLSLGVLEGCLSVFCNYNSTFEKKNCFDIWVMKEYGVSDTWMKLYTIPDVFGPGALFYYPLSVSATGEILLKILFRLVLYNPNTGTFRNLKIGNLPPIFLKGLEATTYVESLVSPNINDEVQSSQH